MRSLSTRQSPFSIALVCYFGFGMFFLVLSITAFRVKSLMPIPLVLALSALCAALALSALLLGRRFDHRLGLVFVALGGVLILVSVPFAPTEARAMNLGLFLYTNFIMLVWFGPMLFARAFGYSWLLIYCVIMELRFPSEALPFLVTLSMTVVILGELIHAFKKKLDTLSFTDPLTGAWNRRTFETSLEIAVAVSERNSRPLSLLYLDLDDFKAINDAHGHGEGDRILRDFTRSTKEHVRPGDSFARIGGDEFVLMLRDTGADEAQALAERLQSEIDCVSWSYGIAERRPGESSEGFIARADEQMLQKKRRRREA